MSDVTKDPRLPKSGWHVEWHWFWFEWVYASIRGQGPKFGTRNLLKPRITRMANCKEYRVGPLLVTRPMPWLEGPARAHLAGLATPKPIMGHQIGARLCEALGINADVTSRVALIVEPGQPVIVEVTRYATGAEVFDACTVVDNFQLVEKPKE